MKMSELIEMMQDAMNKYGDLDVEIRDTDNGVSYMDVGAYEDHKPEAERNKRNIYD